MKISLLSLSVLCLALTGCDAVSERDCGVFDHPDLLTWQSDTAAGSVTFMSEDGTMINFVRDAVVTNEPFLGTDGASNDEDVLCELTAQVRMEATDGSLAIVTTYEQLEFLLLPTEEESLLVDHRIEVPVATELAGDFPADISITTTRVIFDSERVTYLEDGVTSEEIGGQSYEDVVRIDASEADPETNLDTNLDTNPETNPETNDSVDFAINHITQIVMALEFGVVAFIDANDQLFARIP